MRYLTLSEVLTLHGHIAHQSGGAEGIRELGVVQSAIAQPQISFAAALRHPGRKLLARLILTDSVLKFESIGICDELGLRAPETVTVHGLN
jgi:hypothetical protein